MTTLTKFFKYKKNKTDFNKINLIKEIRETVDKIAQTELWFQMESDKNLIDSCIYQRELLLSRYQHLIKNAKLNNFEIPHKYILKSIKGEFTK